MKSEHLNKLLDISSYCSIDISVLINTYSEKQSDYIIRDLHNDAHITSYLTAVVQGERAINVITEYAVRKYAYEGGR